MKLTLSSVITLVPIEIRKDQKHYIVEDISAGEFYEMPEACIDAIHLINSGETLEKIEADLINKYPEEEINILEFVEQLFDLGLADKINGEQIMKSQPSMENRRFTWISPKLGRFFFNKISFFLYFVFFILNVLLLLTHPTLFPKYKDIFIFNIMLLNIPTWLFIGFILVLIHELGHILAIRSKNLSTKLEIGHRLFLVVLETDMTTVWKLPARDRILLFLGGICFDTVILFCALLGQLLVSDGAAIFSKIMSIVVFDIFIRMIYQCCVYMKTDLYYVLENLTGCYNLMESAQQKIVNKLPFVNKTGEENVVYESEKRTVFIYSILYYIGIVLTLVLFVVFYIPLLIYASIKVFPNFLESPTTLPFWDAVLFSVQILIALFFLQLSWRRKYYLS